MYYRDNNSNDLDNITNLPEENKMQDSYFIDDLNFVPFMYNSQAMRSHKHKHKHHMKKKKHHMGMMHCNPHGGFHGNPHFFHPFFFFRPRFRPWPWWWFF